MPKVHTIWQCRVLNKSHAHAACQRKARDRVIAWDPLEYMKLNGTFLPLKTSLISFLQYNVYYELEGSQEAVLS